MRAITGWSLRAKLMGLALAAAILAVTCTSFGLIAYELSWLREKLTADARTVADILGSNTAAALAFGNSSDLEESLDGLSRAPSVVSASVFNSNGKVVATYTRQGAVAHTPAKLESPGDYSSLEEMVTVRPILLRDELVGYIRIESDLLAFYARAKHYSVITAFLVLISLAIAYVASRRLQAVISAPLLALEQAAGVVSGSCDYRIRVKGEGPDEIGSVVRAFNRMLEVVEKHEARLALYGEELEDEVRVRTRALTEAISDLELARDKAESAAKAKSDFLAMMSHEIRTPMNGVIGMTSLLLDSNLGINERDWVETIRVSGEALLSLLNDMLDFSKIEAGHLELEASPFDIEIVTDEALDLVAESARRKGIELRVVVAENMPHVCVGDSGRLRQVLLNLLSNAVKFTPSGRVIVKISSSELVRPSKRLYRFEIQDTGIGIDEAAQERLFQPFAQADSTTTRRYGGTGLGLAICRRIVTAMGGEVGLESRLGEGSTFWFTVSLAANGELPPTRLNGRKALLAGNAVSPQEGWIRYLEQAGMQIVPLTRSQPSDAFDVVLLNAPEAEASMDAFRILRPDVAAPVILISEGATAKSIDTRRLRIAEAIAKPVRRGPLVGAVTQAIFGGDRKSEAKNTARHRSAIILVAEDNAVNQKLVILMLKRHGHRVDVVGNGVEAVKAALTVPYDVIFMDCYMPEMDGYEATRRLRAGQAGSKRPVVIALTANALAGDRERCLQAGMDDYLSKPVRADDIDRVLGYWLVPTCGDEERAGENRVDETQALVYS